MPEPTLDERGMFWREIPLTVAAPADLETRTSGKPAREFTGIGVPWGEVIEHWFGSETFDRGSIDAPAAKVFNEHRQAIGKVVNSRDTDAGFEISGKISDTAVGRDAWTLMEDGVITSLSIGFEPHEYRVDDNDVLHWTRVTAREFSLVAFPAYPSATIDPSTLRTEKGNHTMPETIDALTRADLTPITAALEDLDRHVQRLDANAGRTTTATGLQWRSMGEFLMAIRSGDDAAAEFHRAYTGATSADAYVADTFVGEFIQMVKEHRKFASDFADGVLPEKGLSIDYVQLDADTTQVAEQAAEGDDLVSGKVTLKAANAKVKTVGGWTAASLQNIDKATVSSLDTTLTALGLKYARYTNKMVSDAWAAQVTAHITADATDNTAALDLAAAATTDDWLDTIVDAALTFEERGFSLDQAHCSVDVFKKLLRLKDGDHRLMRVWGQGFNQVGELDLRQVSGDLANVPVRIIPDRTSTNKFAFSDRLAIKFLESAGAPAQLQDTNVINLTKAFSVYGYVAVLVPFPTAILPIEFGA